MDQLLWSNFLGGSKNMMYLCSNKRRCNMSQQELRSYRLNSTVEPTDEMLYAIMLGVQDLARQSTIQANNEIKRRFQELANRVSQRRQAT